MLRPRSCPEPGAEALRHVGTCARLVFCLDLELICGVSGHQGTSSGPEPTSGVAANLRVGPTSFPVQPF
jgi:hypothetical protein